jgi:hypothetical protein
MIRHLAPVLVLISVLTLPASTSAWAAGSAVLVAATASPTDGSSDDMIRDRLGRLGYTVQILDDGASAYAVDADLILVSNSAVAGLVGPGSGMCRSRSSS